MEDKTIEVKLAEAVKEIERLQSLIKSYHTVAQLAMKQKEQYQSMLLSR